MSKNSVFTGVLAHDFVLAKFYQGPQDRYNSWAPFFQRLALNPQKTLRTMGAVRIKPEFVKNQILSDLLYTTDCTCTSFTDAVAVEAEMLQSTLFGDKVNHRVAQKGMSDHAWDIDLSVRRPAEVNSVSKA